MRKYRSLHPEYKVKEATYAKLWFNEHPDYRREWKSKNPQYHKDWNRKNSLLKQKVDRAWRITNRARCAKNKRIRNSIRYKSDLSYRLRRVIGSRVHMALKGKQIFSSINLLGCSIFNLRKHLEFMFRPGMSWSNYGEWHIDHIRPCANFDLTKPKQQKECFHYTNLQPLWASENLSKGAKYG